MKIHIWVPDYASSKGGIQVLSQFLVRALHDCWPKAQLRVIAKNDASFPEATERGLAEFSTVGWWSGSQRTIAFIMELGRHAARERPNLIITTHVNFAPAAHWVQKLFGIPFMAVGNGIDVWEIPRKQVRRALRRASKLLAISECTRQRMALALNIPLQRIDLFPCTFDSDPFQPDAKPHFLLKRYGLHREQPIILTIARLCVSEQYKGYDQVCRALPAIRDKFPSVRYILGGQGPDRERVVNLVRELGVGDNVLLADYIPEHELREHYNLCDVFAMPSKGEGFGIVFLEALACGKPVIAGNKDGSVDPVLNGRLGVLVDPDSVEEIAAALIAILHRRNAECGMWNAKLGEPKNGVAIPEIIFDPEALRRAVTEAYGYERFVERVRELVGRFVEEKA
jgi:glycosyltransferase involved in cell wall biosynthesis